MGAAGWLVWRSRRWSCRAIVATAAVYPSSRSAMPVFRSAFPLAICTRISVWWRKESFCVKHGRKGRTGAHLAAPLLAECCSPLRYGRGQESSAGATEVVCHRSRACPFALAADAPVSSRSVLPLTDGVAQGPVQRGDCRSTVGLAAVTDGEALGGARATHGDAHACFNAGCKRPKGGSIHRGRAHAGT